MAKLSARGRTEIWRVERIKEVSQEAQEKAKNYDIIKERKVYAAMSDNHLLMKLTCWWKDGMKHDYPWKDQGKQIDLSGIKSKLEALSYR